VNESILAKIGRWTRLGEPPPTGTGIPVMRVRPFQPARVAYFHGEVDRWGFEGNLTPKKPKP
jgi:hypothetical protein